MQSEGLITIRSNHAPQATMQRLQAEILARSMTIFTHIDHGAAAAAVGLSLPPTDLLIFGNAQVGTALMQAAQTIGIDLPLKALIWQDASGATWLSYNDPLWLARRHGLDEPAATLKAMSSALQAIAENAAAP